MLPSPFKVWEDFSPEIPLHGGTFLDKLMHGKLKSYSLETWGVSLTWRQSCWIGVPAKLEVGGNYLWCLIIVIFMGLGRAKRLGVRGGFKVITWGKTSHKRATINKLTKLLKVSNLTNRITKLAPKCHIPHKKTFFSDTLGV